jgi:hypothetical protein
MASDKHISKIGFSKKVPKIPIQNPKMKGKFYKHMPVSLSLNRHIPGKEEKQEKVADKHEIEHANVNNVPRYIKSEFGGYFLVHNGYKYRYLKKTAHADIWICVKCPGTVHLKEFNKIVEHVRHIDHELPQLVAEMETFPTYKDPLSPENVKQLEEAKWIYHDGFTYKHQSNNSDTNATRLYYVCEKVYRSKDNCKGRAIVEVGLNEIVVTVQHDHEGEKFINGNFLTYRHLGIKYLGTGFWWIFRKRIPSKIKLFESDPVNLCSRANFD